MPLSDHEQRQLEQIEQALYADYPKLAQTVRARDPRVHYQRRTVMAAVLFLLGAAALAVGVIVHILPLDAGGGAVMLISALWALISWRHASGAASRARARGAARGRQARAQRRARPSMAFMERLEERWHRRQGGAR